MAMSNDSASAGAALFAATNMSMFAMIEANRAAQRQQTIMAVINNKEYIMDNKLLQQLKDECTEITVTVMDNFGIKGRIVDFDDCFIRLESDQRNFKKKVQLLNRLFITKIVVKEFKILALGRYKNNKRGIENEKTNNCRQLENEQHDSGHQGSYHRPPSAC